MGITSVAMLEYGEDFDLYVTGRACEDWLLAYSYEDYLVEWNTLYGDSLVGMAHYVYGEKGEFEGWMEIRRLDEERFHWLTYVAMFCTRDPDELFDLELQLLM